MSNRELTNSNLESLQLETPANLKSNAAKDEANVKLEHGDALKATNQDTKSTKLEANIKLFKTEANLKDFKILTLKMNRNRIFKIKYRLNKSNKFNLI